MADQLAKDLPAVLSSEITAASDLFVVHRLSGNRLYKMTATEAAKFFAVNSGAYNIVDYGATGDGSTDDSEAIQDAIDAANTAGGGTVIAPLPASFYKCSSTLEMKAGVAFRASHSAEFRMSIDDVLLSMSPDSYVEGGYWRNSYSSLSEGTPIILFKSDASTYWDRDRRGGLHNLLVRGPGVANKGMGIRLETGGNSSATEAVQWLSFSDLTIDSIHKGISLFANEDSGDAQSFVNGNNFSNVFFDHFVYGIHIATDGTATPAASGNSFNNVTFQTTSLSVNAIYIGDSDCRRNMFNNVSVYDIAAGSSGASTQGIVGANTASAKEGNCFTNVRGLTSSQVSLGDNDVAQPAFPAS